MRKISLDHGWLAMLVVATLLASTGCTAEASEDEEETESTSEELAALRAGVNSAGCRRSPYNCTLNPGRGQRVVASNGGEEWAVDGAYLVRAGFAQNGKPYMPVLDGNGTLMGKSTKTKLTLNYGQTRRIGSSTYVYALSAGIGSSGWVLLDGFVDRSALRARVGEVNARGAGLAKMACYEIASGYDRKFDAFKVVKGSTDADSQEPNDYLPQRRPNGRVYANLAFNVPGDALGAPAVDIFPAGTKFQRLEVPTWESPDRPSLDANLYAKPAGGTRYTVKVGTMKFLYGYVKAANGALRYGWMPMDGLTVSSGCPDR